MLYQRLTEFCFSAGHTESQQTSCYQGKRSRLGNCTDKGCHCPLSWKFVINVYVVKSEPLKFWNRVEPVVITKNSLPIPVMLPIPPLQIYRSQLTPAPPSNVLSVISPINEPATSCMFDAPPVDKVRFAIWSSVTLLNRPIAAESNTMANLEAASLLTELSGLSVSGVPMTFVT